MPGPALRASNTNPTFINDDDRAGDLYDSAGIHYVLIRRTDYDKLRAAINYDDDNLDESARVGAILIAAHNLVDNDLYHHIGDD